MSTSYTLRADLALPAKIRNHYAFGRHGRSENNLLHILISNPIEGIPSWGLCEEGKVQVENSIRDFSGLDSQTEIISSPFRRARETAEIIQKHLGVQTVRIDHRLRERWFGKIDRTQVNLTEEVWARDKQDPDHNHYDMESPNQVGRRVAHLIRNLEENFTDKNILLVSHGDICAIAMALFLRKSPGQHSEVHRFKNAEIRGLGRLLEPPIDTTFVI